MRSKKSLKNIFYSFLFNLVFTFLLFVSRAVFLNHFNADYLGLTTIITNIIGVLSITELGITSAIGYALYTHLKSGNYNKINELMKFIKQLYIVVGILIFTIGLLILPFFDLIFTSNIEKGTVQVTYLLFLITTVTSYFFTYKQVLIVSDQNMYVVTNVTGIIRIIRTLLQIILIIFFENYFLWIFLELIGNLLTYIIINRAVTKRYKWLNLKGSKSLKVLWQENKDVIINIKNLMFHKLSGIITNQTDSIIISIVSTARDIALYSNYLLVVNGIVNFSTQIFSGLTASIGNLITEKNKEKSYNVFLQLYYFEFFVGVILTYVLYKMINPFIEVWIGSQYLFTNIFIIVISINFFIQVTRRTVDFFKDGFGIFSDIYAPLIQGLLNLIISLIFGYEFGIIGVYIGTFISSLPIISIWRPYILYRRGFGISFKYYFINVYKLVGLSFLVIIIFEMLGKYVDYKIGNWKEWIVYSTILTSLFSFVLFVFYMCLKPFREMILRGTHTINSIIKRN